ncbi:uncharacterized protein LOC121417330 [Lytechinus variegatus]|uniref:uncharacterized protein LOC121417330 n=1 Tax=Lytechinus variegatus TaxID=7654 RepID=UPI001BB1C459|nr:uncharacterized protein LOC121417330 [Lytechinus variegatus]
MAETAPSSPVSPTQRRLQALEFIEEVNGLIAELTEFALDSLGSTQEKETALTWIKELRTTVIYPILNDYQLLNRSLKSIYTNIVRRFEALRTRVAARGQSPSFPELEGGTGNDSPPFVTLYGNESPPFVNVYGNESPPFVDLYGGGNESPPFVNVYGNESPPFVELYGDNVNNNVNNNVEPYDDVLPEFDLDVEVRERREEMLNNVRWLIDSLNEEKNEGERERFTAEEIDEMMRGQIEYPMVQNVNLAVSDEMVDLYNAIAILFNGEDIDRREGEDLEAAMRRAWHFREGDETILDEILRGPISPARLERERERLEEELGDPLEQTEREIFEREGVAPPLSPPPYDAPLQQLGREVLEEQDIIVDRIDAEIGLAEGQERRREGVEELENEIDELLDHPVDPHDLFDQVNRLNDILNGQERLLERAAEVQREGMAVGQRAANLAREYENYNAEMANVRIEIELNNDLLDQLNIEDIVEEHARYQNELDGILEQPRDEEEVQRQVNELIRNLEHHQRDINHLENEIIEGVEQNEQALEQVRQVREEIHEGGGVQDPVDLERLLEALHQEIDDMANVIDFRNQGEQYARYLELQERLERAIEEMREDIERRNVELARAEELAQERLLDRRQEEQNILNDVLDMENEALARPPDHDRILNNILDLEEEIRQRENEMENILQDVFDLEQEVAERNERQRQEAQEAALLEELQRQQQQGGADDDDDDDNDQQRRDIPPNFELTEENVRRYYRLDRVQQGGLPGRFGEQTTLFGLRVLPLDDFLNYYDGDEVVSFMIQDAIDQFLPPEEERRPQDLIHVHISHPRLRHGDIRQLRRVANWNIGAIMNNIGAVLQSNEDWIMGLGDAQDGFTINIMYIRRPGPVGMHPISVNIEDYLKKSKSFLQVNDPGVLCIPISISLAMAHAKKEHDSQSLKLYRQMTSRENRAIRRDVATRLLEESGVSLTEVENRGGCLMEDIETIDKYIKRQFKGHYYITVYSYENKNHVIYRKQPENKSNSVALNLYMYKNHCGVVTKLESFFGVGYRCPQCGQHFHKKTKHQCTRVCSGCKKGQCERGPSSEHIKCEECNRWLMSRQCFVKHLEQDSQGRSTCKTLKRCKVCNGIISSEKGQHKCGIVNCRQCHVELTQAECANHRCYMTKIKNVFQKREEQTDPPSGDGQKKGTKRRRGKKKTPDEIPSWDPDRKEALVQAEEFMSAVWKHLNLDGTWNMYQHTDPVHACLQNLERLWKTVKKEKENEKDILQECCVFFKGVLDGYCVGTYLFYDFECRQDEPVDVEIHKNAKKAGNAGSVPKHPDDDDEGNGVLFKHVPNLVVVHRVCDYCWNRPVEETCFLCQQREWVWKGDGCEVPFCDWLFDNSCFDFMGRNPNKYRTAFAHNFKGYDGMIIKQYLFERGVAIEGIECGSKLMKLSYQTILFLDTLNFLPMSLNKMGKTFELNVKKGDFPHFFNTKENQDYIGPLPDPEYYGLGYRKSEKEVADFMVWHEETKKKVGNTWNFQDEMLAYCKNDVLVLCRAAMTFKKMYYEVTGVDPFESVTIAGACMKTFRSNHLQPETIPIIPPQGYDPTHQSRLKGLMWLHEKLKSTDDTQFKYSYTKDCIVLGETGTVKATGEGSDGKVYVYHPCVWHGCPQCFPTRSILVPFEVYNVEKAYQDALSNRAEIIEYLKQKGMDPKENIVEIWEHDIDFEPLQPWKETLITKHPRLKGSLNPRNAFYGGRTGPCRLQCQTNEREKILYYDVCSLYPWVNKTCKYPVGHPTVIRPGHRRYDAKNVFLYEGLIWCDVIPPRRLFHPLLPYRCNHKLLFGLCRSCMESMQQQTCTHNDDERCMTGTWTTMELQKATLLGYTVRKIHEIWQFDEVRGGGKKEKESDTEEDKESLFENYMKTFMKVKQESSGWPAGLEDESDAETISRRQLYIEDYYNHENVQLDYCKIAKNPGMRAVAKLCLNSLWGKLGQRSNISNKTYFCEPNAFYDYLNNRTQTITDLELLTPDIMCVHSHPNEEFETAFCNTNVVMAAYTTSHARLKLYTYLETLQDRVLYYDTDSVFFIQRNDVPCPLQTGNYLGDLTDEVMGDFGKGAYISEFYAGGPKNYAYKVKRPNQEDVNVVKVRGITLNVENQKKVNFDTVKTMILGDMERCVVTDNHKIQRNKHVGLVSGKQDKEYRVLSTKRVLVADLGHGWTLPYGY